MRTNVTYPWRTTCYPYDVGMRLSSARTRRRVSWALLAALLPMLTFMGHWPASLPIPGTDLYVSVPFAGAEQAHSHEAGAGAGAGADEASHEQHCHAGAAGCSDIPAAAGVSFGLMNQPVAFVIGGLLLLMGVRWWQPRASTTISPVLQPPRQGLSPLAIS
jgi:hypothetical protein